VTNQKEEFSNENIQAFLTREPGCLVQIEVEANADFASDQYKKALKNIRKSVSIPGFRKGKVPDDMLHSKYSSEIEREFRELFLQKSVQEATKLCNAYPWDQSKAIKSEVIEISDDKGGKFKFEFETYPDLPSISPEEIKIKEIEPKEITEKEVEEHIQNISLQHADWNEVKDREVQDGDFVTAKLKFPNEEEKDAKLHIKKDVTEEWVYDALLGKKLGETFDVTPPNKEGEGEVEAPPSSISVTVQKIETAEMPALDDELAKKFGLETFNELKEKVETHLSDKEQQRIRDEKHIEVQQYLIDNYPFDVPKTILDKEIEAAKKDLISDLVSKSYSDEKIKESQPEIEKAAKNKAEQTVRLHYILHKILEDTNLETSEEEVVQEVLRQSIRPDGSFDAEMYKNADRFKHQVKRHLQLMKALDYLTDHATTS